mgnify:CR=1 FL=1
MVKNRFDCRAIAANSGDNSDKLRILCRGSSHDGSLLMLGIKLTTEETNLAGVGLDVVGLTVASGHPRLRRSLHPAHH